MIPAEPGLGGWGEPTGQLYTDAAGLNVKGRNIVELGKSAFPNSRFRNRIRTAIGLMVGRSGVEEGTGMICSGIAGMVKAESRWKQLV